jgi:hypothetical protein
VANPFQLAGAQSTKQSRMAPIYTSRFFTGLVTQKSPLRSAGSWYEERYFGTRSDSLIDGSNTEISNRLTLIRRPGNPPYNSNTFTSVDYFYEFRLFNTSVQQIRVMADTSTALYEISQQSRPSQTGDSYNLNTLVFTKSASAIGLQTYMQYFSNTLYFSNTVDQKKWVQTLTLWAANTSFSVSNLQTFIVDTNGNIQQLIGYEIPITNVAITSDVLTITTSSTLTGVLAKGDQVQFFNVAVATFLNQTSCIVDSVSANSFTASYLHADYASAADTGDAVASNINPTTGGSQPTWNTSVSVNSGLTKDNTAVWFFRGNPIQNWGIVGPTTAPTVAPNGAITSSWAPNTYFANTGNGLLKAIDPNIVNNTILIDDNGGIQKLTTAGTGGNVTPSWPAANAGVGTTTTDGTAVWTKTQTLASRTWTAGTSYSSGDFITATVGGVECLFQLAISGITLSGGATGVTLGHFNGQNNGAFNHNFPAAPVATYTVGSLNYNDPRVTGSVDAAVFPMTVATIDGAGTVTGSTTPDAAATSNYGWSISGSIVIPTIPSGNYTLSFKINHDDGMVFGFANSSVSYVSGFQVFQDMGTGSGGAGKTAVNGYTLIAGQNNSGFWPNDTYQIMFPGAGTYAFEFDYANWHLSEQTMIVQINGLDVLSAAAKSQPTTPVFPASSFATPPTYPSVTETSGRYTWYNLGPTKNFKRTSSSGDIPNNVVYVLNNEIVDGNGNIQVPFSTGVTEASPPGPPSFSTTLFGTTPDGADLIWMNDGPAGATQAGTLTTLNGGWIYYVALVNTLTDTVSNVGLASTITGNFRGAAGVQVSGGLPSSIDPQVDYVAIFRTKDGGSTPFLIPGGANPAGGTSGSGVSNTVFTVPLAQYQAHGYFHTTPDSGLNILLQAPIAFENTPPPPGARALAFHLDRIFYAIGNVVYWTSGPDAPIGNGIEGNPSTNSATFPSQVTRIVPNSLGAMIFTVSDIYLISGNGTAQQPLFSLPYAEGVGLLSYNALAVNGVIINFFSSDGQVLSLDPNAGFSEVGTNIGNLFEQSNWNPSSVYVAWHVSGSQDKALYVADGSTGWFRLLQTPAPESGYTWAPFATIVGGVKAVQSIEVAPGTHKLLLGPASTGKILNRDLSTWQDNGVSYTAFATIGSIMLAESGRLAELLFLSFDAQATGTLPNFSVIVDEISGTFESLIRPGPDPAILEPSGSLYSRRLYFSETQQPAYCRHIQVKVSWPAENFGNEIMGWTLNGTYIPEL